MGFRAQGRRAAGCMGWVCLGGCGWAPGGVDSFALQLRTSCGHAVSCALRQHCLSLPSLCPVRSSHLPQAFGYVSYYEDVAVHMNSCARFWIRNSACKDPLLNCDLEHLRHYDRWSAFERLYRGVDACLIC